MSEKHWSISDKGADQFSDVYYVMRQQWERIPENFARRAKVKPDVALHIKEWFPVSSLQLINFTSDRYSASAVTQSPDIRSANTEQLLSCETMLF